MLQNKNNLGVKLDQKNKIQLTKAGLEERKQRLEELITKIRPNVLKELSEARAQGDLSENADYDAAKNKQAEVEEEIMNLEDLLTRVEIVNNNSSNKAEIGKNVTYKNLSTNKEFQIQLVSAVEADPTKEIPQIGTDSPIGLAIAGSQVGDKRIVSTAKKSYEIKILKIK